MYLPLGMYALRIVDDADVSEDLVQDAFMKAWLYIENGGEIDNFSSFMYRSVRNICLSYLRDRREMLDESNIPEVERKKSTHRSGTQESGKPLTACLKNAVRFS